MSIELFKKINIQLAFEQVPILSNVQIIIILKLGTPYPGESVESYRECF